MLSKITIKLIALVLTIQINSSCSKSESNSEIQADITSTTEKTGDEKSSCGIGPCTELRFDEDEMEFGPETPEGPTHTDTNEDGSSEESNNPSDETSSSNPGGEFPQSGIDSPQDPNGDKADDIAPPEHFSGSDDSHELDKLRIDADFTFKLNIKLLDQIRSDVFSKTGDVIKGLKSITEKHNLSIADLFKPIPPLVLPKDDEPENKCKTESCERINSTTMRIEEVELYIQGAREYVRTLPDSNDKTERLSQLEVADVALETSKVLFEEGKYEVAEETLKLARSIADFVIGATPIVGDLVDITSAVLGKNFITGEALTDEERLISAAAAVASLASGGIVGTIKDAAKGGLILGEIVKQQTKNQAKKEAKKAGVKIAEGELSNEIDKRTKQVEAGAKIADRAKEKLKAADFEASLKNYAGGERVALIKTTLKEVANKNGWEKNRKLSSKNNRDVYTDAEGNHWSVDTRHGRFEKLDSKGKHQGEFDIDLDYIDNSVDPSGKHDLTI